MTDLSIITVNFRNSSTIKKLWESLHQHSPKADWEWIIVDNNSGKSEVDELKKLFAKEKKVHLITLGKNEGFGKGNEEGIRFATGKYVAFVNPDIELSENVFDVLIQELKQDTQIGVVAPKLFSQKGKPLENARKFPSPLDLILRRFGKKPKKVIAKKQISEVDWLQGSFLVMKKNYFELIGGFDPRFFLFFEDTDLCWRIWESGKKVILDQNVSAIHGEKRLSGNDIWYAMWKKSFWLHLQSAWQYFWKYKKRLSPRPK